MVLRATHATQRRRFIVRAARIEAKRRAAETQLELPLAEALLRRVDPDQNMHRYYLLAVERDLMGNVVLVRSWGRIGRRGVTRRDEHVNEAEAWKALAFLKAQKERRGYLGR